MNIVMRYRKKHQISTKEVLLRALYVYTFITFWGCLGFSGVIGYVYAWELYPIIMLYGGCLAIYESSSRTLFCEVRSGKERKTRQDANSERRNAASTTVLTRSLQVTTPSNFTVAFLSQLVPPGQEAEFFGIYEISDKGSSWIGPMIVAILYDRFGSVRYAFVYLLGACLLSVFILKYYVDVEKGAQDCRNKKHINNMELIRKKFGVSKKQIQAEIKKRKKLGSSVASSAASSMASSAISTMDSRSTIDSKGGST